MTQTGVCDGCVCVCAYVKPFCRFGYVAAVVRVRVCVCVCVCSWKCKRETGKSKVLLPIWFLHHCGGITLSIVGSLGISSVCNISLIHAPPRASLRTTILRCPSWHCGDPVHPLVTSRTPPLKNWGIKLSKLRFSHLPCFALVVRSSTTYVHAHEPRLLLCWQGLQRKRKRKRESKE